MKKEQPILNFNDFGTIKRLLGLGSPGSGSLDDAAPSDTQGTQIRPGPVEEEREWKRTKLESAED